MTKGSKTASFSFDSTALVKRLLAAAPPRAREVLARRFGLGPNSSRETLEAIGDRSGITRERVRQIEAAGLDAVRASRAFTALHIAFEMIWGHSKLLFSIVQQKIHLNLLGL